MQTPFQRVTPQVKAHLSVLLALLALVKAAGYWLQRYELTVSTRGTVDGATYTDVKAQLPAIRLLLLISLFVGRAVPRQHLPPGLGPAGARRRPVGVRRRGRRRDRARRSCSGSGSSRRSRRRKRPYIERNIAATRAAIEPRRRRRETRLRGRRPSSTTRRPGRQRTTRSRNIRLWDPADQHPRATYQALQELQPFYGSTTSTSTATRSTAQTDPGRCSSSRELNTDGVPQSSWEANAPRVHPRLRARARRRANAQTPTASPTCCVQRRPDRATRPSIAARPARHLLRRGPRRLRHRRHRSARRSTYQDDGGDNVTDDLHGPDGVNIGSWLRRAAFALRFGDFNPLFSGNLTPSRGSSSTATSRSGSRRSRRSSASTPTRTR